VKIEEVAAEDPVVEVRFSLLNDLIMSVLAIPEDEVTVVESSFVSSEDEEEDTMMLTFPPRCSDNDNELEELSCERSILLLRFN
jgi:hypothetical protein